MQGSARDPAWVRKEDQLTVVAASGHIEIVNELLNAGAEASATNEKGQTPL
jgi:ankyrin repeat protein